MENNITPQRAALNILAKAAELYVANLDELARGLSLPQFQQAIQILNQLVDQAEAAPATPTGDA